ncbi:MAG: hypothetical protein K6B40_07545 [Firmicutes bacterium]|nr:hypothetical protein [Bacillota bacterium]
MKKTCFAFITILLLLTAFSLPAAAYINRGTVQIHCDTTALTLAVGQTVQVPYSVDPAESLQTQGCGMADCPDGCGANCLSREGNCVCVDTVPVPFYTEVLVKKIDERIVSVSCDNGIATFQGLAPGSCTVNLAARLREFTGSSVDIAVTVEGAGTANVWWIAGICLLLALILLTGLRLRKRVRG